MSERIKNLGDKANTNGFDKNPQNRASGRPKSIYTVLKDKGYNKDDIRPCFTQLAYYTPKELKDVVNDPEKPVIMHIIAKAMLRAIKAGRYDYVRDIINQVIGTPKVVQEIQTPFADLSELRVIRASSKSLFCFHSIFSGRSRFFIPLS